MIEKVHLIVKVIDELDAYVRALVDRMGDDVPVVYMAHPVAPDGTTNLADNVTNATLWLQFLLTRWPRVAWIAPWIVETYILNDQDDVDRAGSLRRCCATLGRADAVLLVGGRVSSGMDRERSDAWRQYVEVVDACALGVKAPFGS